MVEPPIEITAEPLDRNLRQVHTTHNGHASPLIFEIVYDGS